MIDFQDLKVGCKVYYAPEHYKPSQFENGIVKSIPSKYYNIKSVFVVYNCNNDWKNYRNYTAALTDIKDLRLGWKED